MDVRVIYLLAIYFFDTIISKIPFDPGLHVVVDVIALVLIIFVMFLVGPIGVHLK